MMDHPLTEFTICEDSDTAFCLARHWPTGETEHLYFNFDDEGPPVVVRSIQTASSTWEDPEIHLLPKSWIFI